MEYVLELKTVQSNVFRILFEALKEILTDINITFSPEGMKIFAIDASHCTLVHLKLDANKFSETGGYFKCEREISLGLNLTCLWKLIKTVSDSEDVISWYVEKSDTSILHILIENAEKGSSTKFDLKLLDLDEDQLELPSQFDFKSVITIPSQYFQKLCRDMQNLAEDIEIKTIGEELIFSCKGDFAKQETKLGSLKGGQGVKFSKSDNSVTQGKFNLKYLLQFTKATNLCSSIKMYLENDFPLVLEYKVASLGSIKFLLSPKESPNE
jgi:proliferating cell nuclear antigen